MGSIKVLGKEVPVIARDKDIRKEFKPFFNFEKDPGFYIDSHLFKAAAMELIDYNVGAFGSCVGYRIIVLYLDPSFSGMNLMCYKVIDLNIGHEQFDQMENGRFNLDIHICKSFGFSAGLMCSLIQSIDEKANRSSD